MKLKQLILAALAFFASLPALAQLTYNWDNETKTLTVTGDGTMTKDEWVADAISQTALTEKPAIEHLIVGGNVIIGEEALFVGTTHTSGLVSVTFQDGYTGTSIGKKPSTVAPS